MHAASLVGLSQFYHVCGSRYDRTVSGLMRSRQLWHRRLDWLQTSPWASMAAPFPSTPFRSHDTVTSRLSCDADKRFVSYIYRSISIQVLKKKKPKRNNNNKKVSETVWSSCWENGHVARFTRRSYNKDRPRLSLSFLFLFHFPVIMVGKGDTRRLVVDR